LDSCQEEHSFNEQKIPEHATKYHFFVEYLENLIKDENQDSRIQVTTNEDKKCLEVMFLGNGKKIGDL
jgi:hypothetical protein